MRTIRITEDVWEAIANRGRFGETENDVLRRIFKLETPPTDTSRTVRARRRFAEKKMSTSVNNGYLIVEIGGARQQWLRPEIYDKAGIRQVRDAAVQWALEQGASNPGQANAVRKALTDAAYYVSR